MFNLRLMSVAVLFHENDMLMMKRSPTRTLSPGKWAAIGGHLEPSELSNPLLACLREVEEETGLAPHDIKDLQLRYILLRQYGSELRQQFVYVGQALRKNVAETEEGELHWIPKEHILDRDIPFIFHSLLAHWLENGPAPHLWLAVAGLFENDKDGFTPSVQFIPVTDPGLL